MRRWSSAADRLGPRTRLRGILSCIAPSAHARVSRARQRPSERATSSRRAPTRTAAAQGRPRRTMYAVIETGGKQYRVELGTEIEVDRLDVEPGRPSISTASCSSPTATAPQIGSPSSTAPSSRARSCARTAATRSSCSSTSPRRARRVKQGHRAELTVLRIADIALGRPQRRRGGRRGQDKTSRPRPQAAARPRPKKAAADQALAAKLAAEQRPRPTQPRPQRPARHKPAAETTAASLPRQADGQAPPRPRRRRPRRTRKTGCGQADDGQADAQASQPRQPTPRTSRKTTRSTRAEPSTKKDE